MGNNFIQICEDVACILGLKKANSQSLHKHIESADVDFEQLMREVDGR